MIRLGWHVFGLLNVFVLGIQPVLPKKISPECSLEGLMLKLKLQYFGPPDGKNRLTGKDPEEQKGTTEDEVVGWHHRLNGHEFE